MLRDHKRILVWNVRRSSSSNFFIYLTDLISDYKPSIVILLEAPSPDDSLRRLCTRHGFSNFQFVDAMNQRGGIWYLWKHPVRTVDFISTEPALFHSLLTLEDGEPEVVLTAMHARVRLPPVLSSGTGWRRTLLRPSLRGWWWVTLIRLPVPLRNEEVGRFAFLAVALISNLLMPLLLLIWVFLALLLLGRMGA